MKIFLSLVFSLTVLQIQIVNGQAKNTFELNWITPVDLESNLQKTSKFLHFEGADHYLKTGRIPIFTEKITGKNGFEPSVHLISLKTRTVKNIFSLKEEASLLSSDFDISLELGYEKGFPIYIVKVTPIKTEGSNLILLDHFTLNISWEKSKTNDQVFRKKRGAKINSKLKEGQWFEIKIKSSGVYKLSKSFFTKNNINLAGIELSKIAIYGYGGRNLPMKNSVARPEDLEQIPCGAVGLEDGNFQANDYLYFYAEGSINWELLMTNKYKHSKNSYTEEISYFICLDGEARDEVQTQSKIDQAPSKISNSYDYLAVHHIDMLTDISRNVKSGREWYGEEFNFNTMQNFDLGIVENLILEDSIYFKSQVAARNLLGNSNFSISTNGKTILDHSCSQAQELYYKPYVTLSTKTSKIKLNTNELTFLYEFDKPNSNAIGWLNYFEVVARARLNYLDQAIVFSDKESISNLNSITQFNISSSNAALEIWEIGNLHNPRKMISNLNGSELSFKAIVDRSSKYIVFNPEDATEPTFSSPIENQNLHGHEAAELFIITDDSFMTQAEELAEFHRNIDNHRVLITTPQKIYNEFSNGTQDVTAIRDFMRYFYETASVEEDKPKFLILFGDASYDFQNRISGNTNLVPSYQSLNSIDPEASYVSDDYYGLLDPEEGDWENGGVQQLDIAIGRLPVHTYTQATEAVAKIKSYYNEKTLGDWRNNLLFVSDDEDGNRHLITTEKISKIVNDDYPLFNIKKVYFDSYIQENGPGGAEYPEVETRIDESVEKGMLVVNYVGHGGELGWAHERVLDNSMIRSWNNLDHLSLFVTATCEFSRFDDPERVSAGENVFLNPNGGAIALLTTTRVVYSLSNENLLIRLYTNNMFEPENGEYKTLGEIIRRTKNLDGLKSNTRNFVLLGDPALKLAYPKFRVQTSTINGKSINNVELDTIRALSKVSITGFVTDANGNELSEYNGVVYPTIYDKSSEITTLGNDEDSKVTKFDVRKNIIYKGKATVSNGKFSFEFVVPKDISYKIGQGKISYYTEDGVNDGNGSFFDFNIGGTAENSIEDDEEPNSDLYVNDLDFTFGGISNEDPLIIGLASDNNGINTVGAGIGHELTLTIDEGEPITVNDYYEAELDDHTAGRINYPLKNLSEGRHSASLKVWDVANNSSTAYTEFVVANSAKIALDHVLNYPNPFTTNTTFWITHNRPMDVLDVSIQIFSIAGKLVKTLTAAQAAGGSTTFNEISWNGLDDFGNKIGKGVYVYKVNVKASDGSHAEVFEKLVILN